MTLLGIHLAGFNAEVGRKLLLSLILLVVAGALGWLLTRAARLVLAGRGPDRARFAAAQVGRLTVLVVALGGLLSIWFDDPARLTSILGLLGAGVAVALQRVIVAFAGYLILLRGRVFSVGDRITMGGVRGDVVELGFMQTTVMEMGEPPGEQDAPPAVWVNARQHTGRLVRVTNDRIFDSPVYNYTREFPFLWEEIHLPVKYDDDYGRAEQILLEVARRHTAAIAEEGRRAVEDFRRRYPLREPPDVEPRVYVRLTDNWIELTVRFLTRTHGVRGLKDAMSRDILPALKEAGIGIASGTYEIVGVPPIRVEMAERAQAVAPR